jgi:hypothetical protein
VPLLDGGVVMIERRNTIAGLGARAIGFVEQMQAGHFRAYCYRCGLGYGPFADATVATAWVHEQHGKGPIAHYSR